MLRNNSETIKTKMYFYKKRCDIIIIIILYVLNFINNYYAQLQNIDECIICIYRFITL